MLQLVNSHPSKVSGAPISKSYGEYFRLFFQLEENAQKTLYPELYALINSTRNLAGAVLLGVSSLAITQAPSEIGLQKHIIDRRVTSLSPGRPSSIAPRLRVIK